MSTVRAGADRYAIESGTWPPPDSGRCAACSGTAFRDAWPGASWPGSPAEWTTLCGILIRAEWRRRIVRTFGS